MAQIKNSEAEGELDNNTAQTQIRTICMYTLKTFFMTPYGTDDEFFELIGQRIDMALKAMGMDD